MVAACNGGRAWVRLFVGRIGRHQPIHPHISAIQNWREQAGLAGPSRGAPDHTRKWVWRKGNLGLGGFVLSSSPHDLREKPPFQSFLWGRFGLQEEWFETLTNPQQNTTNVCSTILYPSMAYLRSSTPRKAGVLTWKRHSTRRHRLLAIQAEKYTGTRLPRFGKACGLLYHEGPIISAPLRRHEKPRRRFQGATSGLLPPSAVA